MTIQEIEETVDSHRMSKLVELCVDHNNSVSDSCPEKLIDLEKYTTPEDLIFNLWYHEIDVGVLGFGYPYDDILRNWVPDDAEEDEEKTSFEHTIAYLSFIHSDRIPDFLYYSLVLKKDKTYYGYHDESHNKKTKRNMIKIKEIWAKIGRKETISNYHDLRKILKSNILTKIELCCLLWECEDNDLFNVGIWPMDCFYDLIH